MNNQEIDRFLDELSACIVLRGGIYIRSREELKKQMLGEILEICQENKISLRVDLPDWRMEEKKYYG